jgi:glyoxylase-like metal-dependent hydrolase (beta-lactamase superfamily II)
MAIFHLNCGSLQPFSSILKAVTYCLLVETNEGLLLVDTGFGELDFRSPSLRLKLFLPLMGLPRDREETAVRHVVRLGFAREDVRHIVLTHLHFDHAGGLRDFPDATVHVHRLELEAANKPRTMMEIAYVNAQWSHGPHWHLHENPTELWFGLDAIPILPRLKPRVLLLPLPGHTRGHCGVAIETDHRWLLHCGDAASPYHRAADPHQHDASRQRLNFLPEWFVRKVIGTQIPRLRQLVLEHADEIELISAHDIYAFNRHAGKSQE